MAMHDQYDYKRFAILYVDDEEKSLKYFTRAFEDKFRILTAASAQAGLQLLEAHKDDIGVLMTDQRMPGEKGTWLLEKARALCPRIIRMLVTAYSDMDAAVAAVNTGAIYKYISKPWDPPQLEATLRRALEFFIVQRERDALLHERTTALRNLIIADRIVGLGLLAAGLSHHIRNALVAVKTFLDLAPLKLREENLDLGRLRDPEFWRDYYQSAQTQLEKINSLLRDLWAASEQPSCLFADRAQVHRVVAETIARLQPTLTARNIVVHNQVPTDLPPLQVDQPKFSRLFELLLKDELASLPPGSQVTFTARVAAASEGLGEHIEVHIRDNGPGLPQEALRLVFDPFALRSDSPLEYGINLMACYFIVHHHGGRIEARSAPNQGTNFILKLPLDPARQPALTDEAQFLQKVLLNDKLLERLLAGG